MFMILLGLSVLTTIVSAFIVIGIILLLEYLGKK